MASTRYAAKQADEQRNRELEATGTPSYSFSLEVLFETDPELIAGVLPKPLEPAAPLARLNITTVQMAQGPAFGAGWFGVHARHGDQLGEYPLFMPMTTEQATIGGRETFGEPKKIGEVVSSSREGDRVEGRISRLGFTLAEVHGAITGERDLAERQSCDFYFKLSPSPEKPGELDADPILVHSHKTHTFKSWFDVDGDLVLKDSPLDPIADFPVRRIVEMTWAEKASVIRAKVVGTVPRGDLLPYLHQRYDDLSVLGTKD